MPIRPMDMQVIVPKVQSNIKAKETVVNKEANELQQSQMRNKDEARIKLKKVQKNEQKTAEDNKIKRDLDERKNRNKGKYKAKSNVKKDVEEKDEDKEKTSSLKSLSYHKFDMKV